MAFTVFAFVLLAIALCTYAQQPVLVTTPLGEIRGFIDNVEGTQYNAFLGVPFAKPPVGDLRFRPPEPIDNWDGVWNATTVAPACPQPRQPPSGVVDDDESSNTGIVYVIDEDCLYLNVYVSGDIDDNVLNPLPVMVYIHGGGFSFGSTHFYDGKHIATQGEPVVLVVIQYRIGLFGFFTSGDDDAPGNVALRDQVMTLEWVQENIVAFGGDKNRVTIFGQSGGGQSVLLHMVSPMSEGLFHRGISQSSPSPWIFPDREDYVALVKDVVGPLCDDDDDNDELVACLRAKNWTDLTLPFAITLPNDVVIDGVFLPDNPQTLYQNGPINDAELIMGFNDDESDALLEVLNVLQVGENGTTNNIPIDSLLTAFLADQTANGYDADGAPTRDGEPLTNIDRLIPLMRGKYIPGDAVQNIRGLMDAFRDANFVTFALWAAEKMNDNGGNVRIYSFEHRAAILGQNDQDEVQLRAPHWHDLQYVFGGILDLGDESTIEEKQLARSMIKAWTSFATDGQPQFIANDGSEVDWPRYTEEHPKYVLFDDTMSDASVGDTDTTWQPVADFWLAVQSLAEYGDDVGDVDDRDDRSSKKYETDVLGLDKFEADLAVVLLACGAFLLLISTCALGCYTCRGSSKSAYIS